MKIGMDVLTRKEFLIELLNFEESPSLAEWRRLFFFHGRTRDRWKDARARGWDISHKFVGPKWRIGGGATVPIV